MTHRHFLAFKWTVYALLGVNTLLYLMTKPTLTPFIDQMAWIVLLATMEYESTSMGERYAHPWEQRIIVGITALAYGVIIYAWLGYIAEEEWLDVVNASAWLLVCALLFWQIYAPGDYEGGEHRAIRWAKIVLYGILVLCALTWTVQATKPLDTVDAWLWILCFAVIESNVFGFETATGAARPKA